MLDAIPRYPISPEVKIACPDNRKHDVARAITESARRRWPVIDIDGARIDLSSQAEGAWFVIRASNTTPFLTVLVEGRDDGGYEIARGVASEILTEHGLDPAPLLSQPPLE